MNKFFSKVNKFLTNNYKFVTEINNLKNKSNFKEN